MYFKSHKNEVIIKEDNDSYEKINVVFLLNKQMLW